MAPDRELPDLNRSQAEPTDFNTAQNFPEPHPPVLDSDRTGSPDTEPVHREQATTENAQREDSRESAAENEYGIASAREPEVSDGDFTELIERNAQLREAGLDAVDQITEAATAELDRDRKPADRTLTTMRYRASDGTVVELFGFSGSVNDWPPANETPERPPKNKRLFESKPVTSQVSGLTIHTQVDSEVKLLEELTRTELERLSGLSRKDVDAAIQIACRSVARNADQYSNGTVGEVERTVDRVNRAIEELNKRGQRNSERTGVPYSPFSATDVTGNIAMVVDYPAGRPLDPDMQICESCQDVLDAFCEAFPGIQIEARNLRNEELYR